MAKTDLSKMSLEELRQQRKDIDMAIANYSEKQRAEARKALDETAAKYGMSVDEILGQKSAGKKKKSGGAPAKYRNPDDASQGWSGRGRQPAWFKERVEKGAAPESMAV